MAGCDCHAEVSIYGLRFTGIHLAGETHPKIISSLIAARADPDQKATMGQPQNWKFDFGPLNSIKGGHSLADRIC